MPSIAYHSSTTVLLYWVELILNHFFFAPKGSVGEEFYDNLWKTVVQY